MIAKIIRSSFPGLESDPNFPDMVNAYAIESSLDGLPPPCPDLGMYRAMDTAGFLHTSCAVVDGRVVGFILVLLSPLPHYSVHVATIESFFVLSRYRQSGAGFKLLREAEMIAEENGSAGIFINAANGKDLSKIMQKMKSYRQTHVTYFKRVNHA